MYNNLQGLLWNGRPIMDPTTSLQTIYTLYGDPLTGFGWVDGVEHPAGDRRFLTACGPVTIAARDTQEIVFATLVAQGGTRLESVRELKKLCGIVKDFYTRVTNPTCLPPSGVKHVPERVLLGISAFPIPVLSSTTIKFVLPMHTAVRLEVTDETGKVLETLVSGSMDGGEHVFQFTPPDGMASGMYFLTLNTGNMRTSLPLQIVK